MSADFTAAIHESPDNEVAWDAWFREIYPRVLYSAVRRASGDVELAEEATQGAMERFLRYRAFERVDSDRSAITYLVRTAARLMIDERRRRGRELPVPERTLERAAAAASEDPDDELKSLFRHLSREERQVLEMVVDGYSVREIAALLELGYSAVGMRIHRAKARLRARLGEM